MVTTISGEAGGGGGGGGAASVCSQGGVSGGV